MEFVTTHVLQLTTIVSLLNTILVQSQKLHLGQIGDYPLFVQVGIEDPIFSKSNSYW